MISTHVLDNSTGTPASGIPVQLSKQVGGEWKEISKQLTNADGRASFDTAVSDETYRILFEVEEYLRKKGTPFYSTVPVIFRGSKSNAKLHIPLLLSPYGYTTYRGS